MILPDFLISAWGRRGGLSPFEIENVNPASVDLTMGESYIDLETDKEHVLTSSLLLEPGQAILATTAEYIKLPPDLAASMYLKSSLALAGWVEPGFEGQLTMELHSHRPIELTPGQRIVQLVLYSMQAEPIQIYNERYQGQRGPTIARVDTTYAGGGKVTIK